MNITHQLCSLIQTLRKEVTLYWYYQIHSHLEYTPRSGEKISCVVDHVSLDKPLVNVWDPSMPESERNKIAIGASGLILGLILSLAGFIYYKSKTRGRPVQTINTGCLGLLFGLPW
uniref:Uncharacterized protein n=1 Tax=Labrus bergylta TaxID=56723 RepID=A0A3Q3FYP8_9LABR